jgi:hypothetical protein
MVKWDAISWWATGIFVVSLVLGGTVHGAFLFLMLGGYLLRPTLNALGLARQFADERQLQIQFHSGNIGFTVAMLAAAILAFKAQLEGRQIGEYVFIISVGVAAKAIVGLVMAADPRTAGVRIACAVGLLATLFTLLDGGSPVGMLVQATPGLVILAIGLLGRWRPLVSAILLSAATIYIGYFFSIAHSPTIRWQMELLVTLPLAVAAVSLFRSTRSISAV